MHCRHKFLKHVPTWTHSPNVKSFDLSFNDIRDIKDFAFANFSSLERITLQDNAISILLPNSFAGLSALKFLDLSRNRLFDISTVQNLPSLNHLKLDFNFLEDISSLNLGNIGEILYLMISKNPIRQLSDLQVYAKSVRAASTGLRVFDVHHSRGARIITELNLNDNAIKVVPDLRNMTSLKILSIAGNPVHSVKHSLPINLEMLISTSSHLSTLAQQTKVPKLRILHLQRNQFRDVPLFLTGYRTSLMDLNMAENVIQSLHYDVDFPFLKKLDLSRCRLQSTFILKFSSVPLLQSLFLDSNNITRFAVDPFRNGTTALTTKLISLSLDGNRLSDFTTLRQLPNLYILSLNENLLCRFDWTLFDHHESITRILLRKK